MPRYMVERTFQGGLQIPMTEDGAKACLNVVGNNAEAGVTWVHSYVSEDKQKTYCIYDAPNLTPGQYRVEVEHPGFKAFRRGPIEVRVGDALDIEVRLDIGAVTETVNVTAEAPILESTNANVGQVIDNRRIQDLPLPGGNPMYLLQLTPGVISTNPPTHGFSLPRAFTASPTGVVGGSSTPLSRYARVTFSVAPWVKIWPRMPA